MMVAKHAENTASLPCPTGSTTSPDVATTPPSVRAATAIALYTDIHALTADAVTGAPPEPAHLEAAAVNAATATTVARFTPMPHVPQRRRRHRLELVV